MWIAFFNRIYNLECISPTEVLPLLCVKTSGNIEFILLQAGYTKIIVKYTDDIFHSAFFGSLSCDLKKQREEPNWT